MKKTKKDDNFKPFRLTLPSQQEESSEELAKQKLVSDYHKMLSDMPPTGSGFNENLVKVARWAFLCGISLEEFDQDIRKAMIGKQVSRPIDNIEIPKAYRTVASTSGENSVAICTTPQVKRAIETVNKFNINKNALELINQKYKDVNEESLKIKSPVAIPSTKTEMARALLENVFFEDEYFFIGAKTQTEPMRIGKFKYRNGPNFNYIVPNPFTGEFAPKKNQPDELSKRSDNAIKEYRYTVVEFDEEIDEGLDNYKELVNESIRKQIRFFNHLIEINVPVAAIVKSGKKSVHAWIAVNINGTRDDWKAKVETLLYKGFFESLGADPSCKNPSRLSRMAGHIRKETGQLQELLYLNPDVVKGKSDKWVNIDDTINILTHDDILCGEGMKDVVVNLNVDDEQEKVIENKWWYEVESKKTKKRVKKDDEIDDVQTAIDIDTTLLYDWFKSNGFGKCYFNNSKSSSLVHEKKSVVYPITWEQVSDYTFNYLDNYKGGLEGCINYHSPHELKNLLRGCRRGIIDEKNLMTIRPIAKDFHVDTKDYSYCYYLNGFTATNKEGTTFHKYSELPAVIWEDSKIQRNFNQTDEKESMMSMFVNLVCDNDEKRIEEMRSMLGYLLHRKKRRNYAKAIVLIDQGLNRSEKGGTGKSMLSQAVGQIRSLVEIDGENAGIGSNQFAFDGVTMSTDIVYLDDISENFDLRKLFSRLTNGFLINRKNKDSITLKFEESPKMFVSTNHAITGMDDSFKRRMVEIEFAPYFNKNHTVYDEFQCMFFEDWDSKEWARFDGFMLECLRLYLEEGEVIETQKVNTIQRQLEVEIPYPELREFFEDVINFHEESVEFGKMVKVQRFNLYNDFRCKNSDFRKIASEIQIGKYMEKYLEIIGRLNIKIAPYVAVGENGNKIIKNGKEHRPQHVRWDCGKKKEESIEE